MKAMDGGALRSLRQRLDRWRREHGGRGKRIPAVLWTEAGCVARAQGLAATARALGLRVQRLREHAEVSEESVAGRVPVPAFVELTGTGTLGASRAVVELVGVEGQQMRIHLVGASTAELVSLAEAFWSRR